MEKVFCPLTKDEVIRIVNFLEDMNSIFWSQAQKFNAEQVAKFTESKNRINAILLKAAGRGTP